MFSYSSNNIMYCFYDVCLSLWLIFANAIRFEQVIALLICPNTSTLVLQAVINS